VDEAEHRSVSTDAESENDNSRNRETRRLVKLPEGELEILDHMQWDAGRETLDSKIAGCEDVADFSGAEESPKWT
jgi:hypothetical protein